MDKPRQTNPLSRRYHRMIDSPMRPQLGSWPQR